MPDVPPPTFSSLSTNRLQAWSVLLIALAASVPGLPNVFTYDDVALIQDNVRLHSLSNWWSVLVSPYWPAPWSQELYRPVMSLLLSLQYAIGEGSPLVFRVTSDILYVGASVMVLLFARRLLPSTPAWIVALLFAAHPVHVEAVAPAVNQGELIVACLAMASLIVFLDARRADAVGPRTWMVLTFFTVIAALTKENGFVIPGLVLFADVILGHTMPSRGPVRTRWRGYAALGVVCALLLWIRSRVLSGNYVGTYTAEALVGATTGERLLTMLQVVPQWFRLLLWPAHLQMDYSPDEIVVSTHWGAAEVVGLMLLCTTAWTALAMRRRMPAGSPGTELEFAL